MQTGRQVGQYTFERKLGEGGIGEVWLARHVLLDNLVAIKFLKAEYAAHPAIQARFLDEGKRQARLEHSHIVKALDFLEENGQHFLVLQYIEGESLQELLDRLQGSMDLARVVALALALLSALQHAHDRKIVHRDVKPSNILLDSTGKPYLTDFGIALAVGDRRLTRDGASVGTCDYISPEQINRSWLVGGRSDIYSFGVVMYQLLTGSLPFDVPVNCGDSDFIIKQKHLSETPEAPRRRNASLPPAVESVVLQALEKEPDQRFQDADSMSAALSAAVRPPDPRPIPRPPSPPPPSPASSKLPMALMAAVLVVIATVAGWWLTHRDPSVKSPGEGPLPASASGPSGPIGGSVTGPTGGTTSSGTVGKGDDITIKKPKGTGPIPPAPPQEVCTEDFGSKLPADCRDYKKNPGFCVKCKAQLGLSDGTGVGSSGKSESTPRRK
jgi:serine/threonine-protein kinase